ncbi:hypothetical protein BC937DRAFT_89358 [Endogone sp. FLAS-F59071]|nr:hypothetical protein BC937DRAFT_89358 [Endogone sp. FLAS-F59071]|eukprot:RUS17908.1 hypothetical protein BC937DRAFT_89358 [Endogone sp. FLAS-F59071]
MTSLISWDDRHFNSSSNSSDFEKWLNAFKWLRSLTDEWMVTLKKGFVDPFMFEQVMIPFGPTGKTVTPPSLSPASPHLGLGRHSPLMDVPYQSAIDLGIVDRPEDVSSEDDGEFGDKYSRNDDSFGPSNGGQPYLRGPEWEDRELLFRGFDSLRWVACKPTSESEGEQAEDLAGCQNKQTLEALRSTLGKLRRVGSLGGADSLGDATTPCSFVLPCNHLQQSVATETEVSVQAVPIRCHHTEERGRIPLQVDTIVNDDIRREFAISVGNKLCIEDGSDIFSGMYSVREYGFSHIIIVGEVTYGIVFLDCYGRVFAWDSTCDVMWPLGNSLEEAKANRFIDCKLAWELEEGNVREIGTFLERWRRMKKEIVAKFKSKTVATSGEIKDGVLCVIWCARDSFSIWWAMEFGGLCAPNGSD